MTTAELIRWSGAAAVLGGLLFAAAFVVAFAAGRPGLDDSLLSRWLALAANILLLLGLIGLYAVQSEATGATGLVGFLLAFAGTVIITGYIIGGTEGGIPEPSLGPIGGLSFTLGLILLALATWLAGILPRWAALLLAVGVALWLFGIARPVPHFLALVGAVVMGAGLVGAGLQMVNNG